MLSSPMMAAADFRLSVDGSDVGAGPVMFQEDKYGLDHTVSFFLKGFDEDKVNFP